MTEPTAIVAEPAGGAGLPPSHEERLATLGGDAWRTLRRKPTFLLAVATIAFVAFISAFPAPVAGLFGHGDPRVCDLRFSGASPTAGHPFGYDVQGCDLYANVIHGARPSLAIGLFTTLVCFAIASVLGLLAAYRGGWVDAVISRTMDVFFGFPLILGGIIILTAFSNRTVWLVGLVLALFVWPTGARIMRASALSVRNADYVLAARALGASPTRIMVRHIFPNAVAPLLVLSTLLVGGVIAAEASLTFLGVGLQLPAISWGLELSTSQGYLAQYPHTLFFPAAFLSVTVLAFIVLGDALQDALDPKQR
jgi:oligopeptide transport system permease protein